MHQGSVSKPASSASGSKPRIIDIALQAGVSTATVDRVLNGRPGVRQKTIDRVTDAIDRLGAVTSRPRIVPAIAAGMTVDVVIAGRAGFPNDVLSRELREFAEDNGIALNFTYPRRMNPFALVEALRTCRARRSSGIIVQALEHPSIRQVLGEIHADGIPIVTIMTDLPDPHVLGYVGLDNRAAGRTAGLLMGRLCHRSGDIAIFTGGNLYRSHEEREIGFRTVIRDEFPELSLLPELVGLDDPQENYRMATELLEACADLVGIFNVGGGNRGIEKALIESGRAADINYIALNLTPLTKNALLSGTIDAVIHQDMKQYARIALGAIVNHSTGRPRNFPPAVVEIVMRENVR